MGFPSLVMHEIFSLIGVAASLAGFCLTRASRNLHLGARAGWFILFAFCLVSVGVGGMKTVPDLNPDPIRKTALPRADQQGGVE